MTVSAARNSTGLANQATYITYLGIAERRLYLFCNNQVDGETGAGAADVLMVLAGAFQAPNVKDALLSLRACYSHDPAGMMKATFVVS